MIRRWLPLASLFLYLVCLGFLSSLLISPYHSPLQSPDELNFLDILQNAQLYWSKRDLIDLSILDAYGYGSIFWATASLLTLPFKNDPQQLIFALRILMLFCVGASLTLLFFAFKNLEFSRRTKAICLALIALSPAVLRSGLMFHTYSLELFFSAVTFYFLSKKTDRGDLFAIIAVAALAGIKLNGLLILPIVGMFIYQRQKNLKVLANLSLTFAFCFLLFHFPAVFTFSPETISKHLEVLRGIVGASAHEVTSESLFSKIHNGFSFWIFSFTLFFISTLAIIVSRDKKPIAIQALLLASILFISFFAKDGFSAGMYLLPFLPFMVSQFKNLEVTPAVWKGFAACGLALSIYTSLHHVLTLANRTNRCLKSDFYQRANFRKPFLDSTLQELPKGALVCVDYRLPFPIDDRRKDTFSIHRSRHIDEKFKPNANCDLFVTTPKPSHAFDLCTDRVTASGESLPIFESNQWQKKFADSDMIIFQRSGRWSSTSN